jgi:alpha-tubulin suppressor-like RCC1 family protein
MVQSGRSRKRLGLLLIPGAAAALLVGALVVSPAQHSRGATAGTPLTWGNNEKGQLGDGTLTSRPDPEYVMGLSGITQVAGGGRHSLALREDGTVFAWGSNDRGQLGDGTTIDRKQPVEVQNLSDVVAISAGGEFSMALESNGSVWTWGDDSFAQLGDGLDPSGPPASTPSDCAGIMLGGSCLTDVRFPDAAGVMPVTLPVQVQGLPVITQISAGQNSALTLTREGNVFGWGEDDHGELAAGGDAMNDVRTVPVPVQAQGLTGVTQISAGFHHGLALLPDSTVNGWGLDDAGQLGNAAGVDAGCTCRSNPLPVLDQSGNPLTGMSAVSGGGQHSLAIRRADGAVLAWGDNTYGQLGDGTTTGREVAMPSTGLVGIVQIAAGGHHSLAIGALQLKINGQQQVMTIAYGWGLNLSGQAGSHQFDDQLCSCRKLPATVTGSSFLTDPLQNVTGIAAGDIHSLAIASINAATIQTELSSLAFFPNGGTSTSCDPGACPPPCTSNCDPTVTPCPTDTIVILHKGEQRHLSFAQGAPCSNTNPCGTPEIVILHGRLDAAGAHPSNGAAFTPDCPTPTVTSTPNPCPSPTVPGCNPNNPCTNGFTAAGVPCNTPVPQTTPCVPAAGVPLTFVPAGQCTPTPAKTPDVPIVLPPSIAPTVCVPPRGKSSC